MACSDPREPDRRATHPIHPDSGVFAVGPSGNAMAFALHDAKNLLTALGANLEWLRSICDADDDANETILAVREMSEVCSQLTKLLVGALSACRSSGSALELSVRATDIEAVINGAVRRVSKRAHLLGIRLTCSGHAGPILALDPALIERVFDNLLDNALKASPPGGSIEVDYGICGAHFVVSIADDGPGVPEVERRRIFDMFVSGHQEPSTGIGLAFCRLVADEHGGYLDVENRPGGGATFYLSLPVPPDDPSFDRRGTALASMRPHFVERNESGAANGSERSGSMKIESQRFGAIEVSEEDVIRFPGGVIGFPAEDSFILIHSQRSQILGWLQSTKTPALALPVVSAHAFAGAYPDVDLAARSAAAGLGEAVEDLAVLVVLSAPPKQPATVNLMAPIIVNTATRTAAQVFLEGTRFSTRELFALPDAAQPPDALQPPSSP